MVSKCFESLIERPSGISGYRPSSWCAVCGRTASSQAVKKCTTQECPNLSHVACLGEEDEYRCGNTGQLRVNAGINDPVTSCSRGTLPAHPAPPHTELDSTVEESEDDLDTITARELKQLVRNLRRELNSTKTQLNNFRCVKDYLLDKRRKLVDELNTVDTLLATLTFEEKQQRSVACTARPHNIAAESEAATRAPREDSPAPQTPRSPTPSRLSSPPPSPSPSSTPHTVTEETESAPSRGDTDNERGVERQQNPQQGSQGASGQRQHVKRKKKPAVRRQSSQSGQQPRQETTGPRLQQDRCFHCRRQGHTQDQCPRKPCDYCQGRYHSSQQCRVKIADDRQRELVQAVRQSSQETLIALRGVAWQLQQPAAQQRVGPILVPPTGTPVPRSSWPLNLNPQPAYQHGATQQHFPTMLHAYQQ